MHLRVSWCAAQRGAGRRTVHPKDIVLISMVKTLVCMPLGLAAVCGTVAKKHLMAGQCCKPLWPAPWETVCVRPRGNACESTVTGTECLYLVGTRCQNVFTIFCEEIRKMPLALTHHLKDHGKAAAAAAATTTTTTAAGTNAENTLQEASTNVWLERGGAKSACHGGADPAPQCPHWLEIHPTTEKNQQNTAPVRPRPPPNTLRIRASLARTPVTSSERLETKLRHAEERGTQCAKSHYKYPSALLDPGPSSHIWSFVAWDAG